jgi:hypothetical protein
MIQYSTQSAFSILNPLIIVIFGLALYTIIVYNLYRFIATRDIFNLNLGQYNRAQHAGVFKFFAVILYVAEYVLFFPLFLMLWFITFSTILNAMTTTPNTEMVLLMSMAIIASIRIAAYYKQDLAKDIAKLIPFALLAVVLVDDISSVLTWGDKILDLLYLLPAMFNILVYYFIFVVCLEILLRVIYGITGALSKRDEKKVTSPTRKGNI